MVWQNKIQNVFVFDLMCFTSGLNKIQNIKCIWQIWQIVWQNKIQIVVDKYGMTK